MKQLTALTLLLLCSLSLFSQTPDKMSYQAIIRNSDNTLAINTDVSLEVIIRQDSPTGAIVFEENHSASTNANGLVSLEIGTGNGVLGNFSNIPWHENTYFVETLVDVNGGTNFSLIGISQLLSVPYALHAKTAESITTPLAPIPYRAEVINFGSNRTIAETDVNNTIACTTTATFTITANFAAMEIGDTINIEAHNGAVLTVLAENGVTLNYTNNGTAQFVSESGNVRFGLLRKSGANAYIISGQ
ncbi:MAG: hypothetical protein ACON5F_08790 [Jejuia sp.]